MGTMLLMAASFAMQAIGTIQQNSADAKARDLANRQAQEQANREVEEAHRQMDEVDRIAADDKSDRVREADRQFASMVVAMSDMGGAGTQNEARLAGEVGGYEGIDLARIEGNRAADNESLRAGGRASQARARDSIEERNATTKARRTARFINLAGAAVDTGLQVSQYSERKKMVTDRGVGR